MDEIKILTTRDDYLTDWCCEDLESNSTNECLAHPIRSECPDSVFETRDNNYVGIIIHDGGGSSIRISFCPFCAKKLD